MEFIKDSVYLEKYLGLYKGVITRDIEEIKCLPNNVLYIKPIVVKVEKRNYYPIVNEKTNICIGLIEIDNFDKIKSIFVEGVNIDTKYKNRRIIFLFRKDEDR